MGMTKEEIIAFLQSQGADLCGIADLSDKNDYIKKPYGEYFSSNRNIDSIGVKAANILQRAGFRTFPIPASDYRPTLNTKGLHQTVAEAEDPSVLPKIEQEIMGDFGHRIAAAKAGLGWVGKSCSIINPQVGPRMRLGTILTDAPFEPNSERPVKYGSCTGFRDVCPVKALHGRIFNCDEDLSERFDAQRCAKFLRDLGTVFGPRS